MQNNFTYASEKTPDAGNEFILALADKSIKSVKI